MIYIFMSDLLSNPDYTLTKKTIIASTFLLVTNMVQMVPLSYEIHTITTDLQVE